MFQVLTNGWQTVFGAMLASLLGANFAQGDITVNGVGKVNIVPDMASVSVGVVTEASNAVEAMDQNSGAVQRLFKLAEQLGIDKKDVQTTSYSIQPKYRYPKDSEPVLIGYVVSHSVQVKVRKLAETGKVLDALVKEGANRVTGITFAVADPQPALDEAREKAMADAFRKAAIYARGGQVTLGPVKSISEASVAPPIRLHFDSAMAAGREAGVPIAPGEQELSVTLTVVFTIEKSQK